MSRPHTQVRRTTPEQFDDFVALWLSARIECASTMDPTTRSLGEERVREALTHSDLRSYLAYVDGRPVGFMVLGQASLFSFTDTPCVCVDQLYVVPEARRAGVGPGAGHAEIGLLVGRDHQFQPRRLERRRRQRGEQEQGREGLGRKSHDGNCTRSGDWTIIGG